MSLPCPIITGELSAEEWQELLALKAAIRDNIAAVHPTQLERFTCLLTRTLAGKGHHHPPYAA